MTGNVIYKAQWEKTDASAAPDNSDGSDKTSPGETVNSGSSGQQSSDTAEKDSVKKKGLVVKKGSKNITVKWFLPLKNKGVQVRKKDVKRIVVKWKVGKKTKTKTLKASKKSFKFKKTKKQKGWVQVTFKLKNGKTVKLKKVKF